MRTLSSRFPPVAVWAAGSKAPGAGGRAVCNVMPAAVPNWGNGLRLRRLDLLSFCFGGCARARCARVVRRFLFALAGFVLLGVLCVVPVQVVLCALGRCGCFLLVAMVSDRGPVAMRECLVFVRRFCLLRCLCSYNFFCELSF